VRRVVLPLLIAIFLLSGPPMASAQGRAFCRPGESPQFRFGFAALKEQVGPAMGEPIECEHANASNGDTLQQTTAGLAFYRKATNTPTFTDGFRHWGLTGSGLAYWEGSSVDPPGAGVAMAPDINPAISQLRSPGRRILVPPAGLQPFADLTLAQATPCCDQSSQFYSIKYIGPGTFSTATIEGSTGREQFDFYDSGVSPQCPPSVTYCPGVGVLAGGSPTNEKFRGMRVGNHPAVVTHVICCNGHYFRVTWLDSGARSTYSMEFTGETADRFVTSTISGRNQSSADAMAALATQLVALQ
jgi:hypothetical protein